jgi:DNA-directed RNA polymerase sigma subunit (sigma70/sigma32)
LLREFVNHPSPTPEDLTDRLGIAREAVRQLQARAEETLRRGRGLPRAS